MRSEAAGHTWSASTEQRAEPATEAKYAAAGSRSAVAAVGLSKAARSRRRSWGGCCYWRCYCHIDPWSIELLAVSSWSVEGEKRKSEEEIEESRRRQDEKILLVIDPTFYAPSCV